MSKTLYEEAIADAKKLKEVAESNAKNAIIESVTPKIREFIEQQLLGNITEEDDKAEDEDVALDESAMLELVKMVMGRDINESVKDPAVKRNLVSAINGATASMTGDQKRRLLGLASKAKIAAESIARGGIDSASIKENSMSSRNRNLLFEVDLNELAKEREMHKMKEEDVVVEPKKGAAKQSPAGTKVVPPKSAVKAPADEGYDEGMYEEGEDETYYMEMTEPDLEGMDEDMDPEMEMETEEDMAPMYESRRRNRRNLREGKVLIDLGDDVDLDPELVLSASVFSEEEPEGGEAEEVEEPEGDEGGDVDMFGPGGEEEEEEAPVEPKGEKKLDEVYEIDENMLRRELFRLRNINESKNAAADKAHHFGGGKVVGEVDKVTMNKFASLKKEVETKGRENRALKGKLQEYRSAVETLREQLTDLNLFNAKLLYVNKLLQNRDLSTTQRRSIIEALDSAGTLREVKLLYKSLTESLDKNKAGNLSESFTRRALGSSSRPTNSSAPKSNEAGEVDRWARLAGIK
jgi:hypothetical protein